MKKSNYLHELFDKIYLDDIINRNKISKNKVVLDDVLDIISSSIGSLTNPLKIANTFLSVKNINISDDTVSRYLDHFIDAFMIFKAKRYDVKGRKYIGSPVKYYYSDIGLRNVRLNFRQTEDGVNKKTNLEVDFVANLGSKKYYIQAALLVGDEEKRKQEVRP